MSVTDSGANGGWFIHGKRPRYRVTLEPAA
jgi:hypothetical protein